MIKELREKCTWKSWTENFKQNKQESYIEFPCQFPIKAMGKASEDLHLHIFEIVKRHAPDTHRRRQLGFS